MDGLSNLIDKLNPALLQKLGKNESPYYDARPFMVPRDEEGNIIPFDPKEGIQLLSSEEDLLQLLDSEEKEEKFEINGVPTTKEGFEMFTNKFMRLNEEGKMMYEMLIEKNPDAGVEKILNAIMGRPEFLSNEETVGDILEERTQNKANGGIMRLRGGGPPGSGSGANKDFKGSYKTGSKSPDRNTGNNQGNQESRQNTANELDQLISGSGLERIIQNKTNTSSVDRVIQDMPQKFQDFVERNTKNGKMNEAAKSIFNRYNDGRNDYQRDINDFRKASDFNNQAYKERFPNPLINIARGIGDVYSKFSPMANIARALNAGNNKVKNFGPVKDSSNMIKDLSSMFGLDGLMGKLVNIAGGKDTNDFNKVIQNNQTSTAMRNNLAYNDPRGLNNAPFYEDKTLSDLQRQNSVSDSSLIGDFNSQFTDGTDQFGSTEDIKRRSVEQIYGDKMDVNSFNNSSIDAIYNSKDFQGKLNAVGDDKQAIEDSLLPGQFNLNTNSGVNLSGDPDEVFEDVSETQYVNPSDVINQRNITTGLSDIPLNQSEDQTDIFNAGSFPEMNIFGNTIGGPRHHLLNQINKYGNASSASEKEAFGILNSLGQADGGYMSNFPNQNTAAPSVTASDNIDNRIMQNLQFEKMAPGMMGYNQGGEVSPVRLNEGGPPNVTEILSSGATIFFVKGDDVIPAQMSKTIMIDEMNPRPIDIQEGTGGYVKKLIDDGYELAVDDGSAESKKIRQLVDGNPSMRGKTFTPIDINDDGVGRKLFNGIKSLGGKIGKVFPALGVLDIFDAKNQYDQILEGTHPMSDLFNEIGGGALGQSDRPAQVYNQGGKVMSTFEKLKAIADNNYG